MHINILGIDYQVILTEEDSILNENVGLIVFADGNIFIDRRQSFSNLKSTLFHEIVEAINYQLELNLEHRCITGLEAGLFSTLHGIDNSFLDKVINKCLEEEIKLKELLE